MKMVLFGVSGISLATWSAFEATVILSAQSPIGPTTGVSVTWVFQVGVLVAAGLMLVKFGMLLVGWKQALDRAVGLATAVTDLEKRMVIAETKQSQQQLLIQEHAARLGLHQTILDKAAI